jgi:hypothetical protein
MREQEPALPRPVYRLAQVSSAPALIPTSILLRPFLHALGFLDGSAVLIDQGGFQKN